ncbi:MAG: DUF998 domain-containing protein [Candidatus Saccharibacteria bacterium]
MKQKRLLVFTTAAALIILSAILYCSWPLGFWLNPAASRTGLASELGAVGQPWNWLFVWLDIVSGLLLGIGCVLLVGFIRKTRGARLCLAMLALYGVCGAIDAALPERCVPSLQVCGPVFKDPQLILHGVFDLLGSAALVGTLIAAWLDVRRYSRMWLPWIYWIGAASTLFAVLSGILYVVNGPGYWAQRYYLTLSCIWVGSLPFVLAKADKLSIRKSRRLRRELSRTN